ncbi:MAG: hypothetical protein J7M21_02225, partial [Planctomycetes bacterium]|nr:hypothetical protein [Planctomycetota bacterium]
LALAALGAAVLGAEKPAGPKVVFKNWRKAGTYEMTTSSELSQDVVINGRALPRQRMDQTIVAHLKVSRPDSQGNRTIELTYKRFKQSAGFGPTTREFDSADPQLGQDPMTARLFKHLLKARITVVLDPEGKVKAVRGLEKLLDGLTGNDPKAAQIMAVLKKQFEEESIKQLVGQTSVFMPAGGVCVGESWTKQSRMNLPFVGQMTVNRHFKLKSVESTPAGKIAKIDYKAAMSSPGGKVTRFGKTTMTFEKLEFKQAGQIEYNLNIGIPVRSRVRQSGTMQMSGLGPDGQSNKVNITQQATVDCAMRELPSEAATKPAASRPAKKK